MKIGERHIDHIVYAVPNLERACTDLESSLGVKPSFGGYHKTKGTMNALLNLGNLCYLEILAVDESNKTITSPRWMGVDLVEEPRITRWAIKSQNLKSDQELLQQYNPEMGEIFGGSRQTPSGDLLEWEMILPLANPEIELAPFMVNWAANSIHPTENLDAECLLVAIEFGHQTPDSSQGLFKKLSIDQSIKSAAEIEISIRIRTTSGDIMTLR